MHSQINHNKDQNSQAKTPIGIFDSGIGGLSVAQAIVYQLPFESLIYFGDSAHLPYGTKSLQTIQGYCYDIAHFLIEEKQCKAVVVACNTASAAAINQLRQRWPDTPFIGMEPAVKPGATQTYTGKVGVLATQGTFASPRYASLTRRFAKHIEVWEDPCIGLVELIEQGENQEDEIRLLLQEILEPMLHSGVDTFVLGCTHYPFVQHIIKQIVGQGKKIINPAPAVARQLAKVLGEHQLLNSEKIAPKHQFFTSGSEKKFLSAVNRLLHMPVNSGAS